MNIIIQSLVVCSSLPALLAFPLKAVVAAAAAAAT